MTDDTSLLALVLYVAVLGVATEALYQKVKVLFYTWRKEPDKLEVPEATSPYSGGSPAPAGHPNPYGPSAPALPSEQIAAASKRRKLDPIDEIVPVVIGVLVVLAFWPYSIFGWMPFHPQYPWLDVLLSALIVSRGANLSHETYRDFGKLVEGLIGRIWRFF